MGHIIGLVIGGFFLLLFIAPIVGVLFGAFSGWIVGLFFEETILGFFAMLGIEGLAVWQIGAALGFAGAFFKATLIPSK